MDTTTSLDELWAAVEVFDTEAAELALTDLLRDVPLSGAVASVVLPLLRQVGDRWEAGTLSVAHEHLVSEMVRRRLLALSATPQRPAPGVAAADAPIILLACPAGERHDLVLLCVSLMLRERGVRVRFLGADTPLPAVATAARAMSADAVVLAGTRSTVFTAHSSALRRLADDVPIYAAGPGADARTVAEIGAVALPDDPVRAVVVLVGALALSGSW